MLSTPLALSFPTNKSKNLAICTDSLSSILSIKDFYSQNPLIQNIHNACHLLLDKNVSVSIIWTLSHVGITGNENADQAAKEASRSDIPMESIQLGVDLQHTVNQMCLRVWQNLWNRTNSKLHSIQPRIPALKIPALCRRDKVVMRRLRIGHCRLTHGYLMSQGNPPLCHTCNTRVTVKHILVECQNTYIRTPEDNINWMKTKPPLLVIIVTLIM
uniref:Uncharacterized protein LOC114342619 n=1 Tax=Diabrotica virgifera virgifera TaxID=50390 RepID=A0A6P7GZQ0_DIAVI